MSAYVPASLVTTYQWLPWCRFITGIFVPSGAMPEQNTYTGGHRPRGRLLKSAEGKHVVSLPLSRTSSAHYPPNFHRPRPAGWHRRNLAVSDGMPLFSGFGTHYVEAQVGNPPHLVSLVVDTGSFNMAFPCSDCEGCRGGQKKFWDPLTSASADVISCDICHGSSYK